MEYYFWYAFLAVILTLAMEYPVFYLFGYRKKPFLPLFVSENISTNVSINLISYFSLIWFDFPVRFAIGNRSFSDYDFLMLFLELLVIAVEYIAFKALLGKSKKLFWVVVLANAFSGIVGSIVLQWILI